MHNVAAAVTQVLLTNSSFVRGQAQESGGAIYAGDSSSLRIYGSSITRNNATWGGVLLAIGRSKVALDACLLDGNTAVTSGDVLQALTNTKVGNQLPISI